MFNPLAWLPALTPLLWLGYGALTLILIGVALTFLFGTFRACLACLRLSGWLLAHWWSWVWQTAARTFGVARWCTVKEMHAAGLFQPGGIILGSVDGREVRSHHAGHVLAVMPTGAYKTTRIVEPNANQWPGSCVILDVKDEVYTHTHAQRQTFGAVWRFSPTSTASCHINPLDVIRWHTPAETGDLQRVAQSLYTPAEYVSEDSKHWIVTAEAFMVGLLADAKDRGDPTLGGVYLWMSDPQRSEDDKLKAMEASPNGTVARAGHTMRQRKDRELSGIWSTTIAGLSLWEDEAIRKATAQSDFDWWDLQDQAQPISLYLHFKLSDEFRLRPLMRLIVEGLLGRVTDRDLSQPPAHKLVMLLDEVARLGQARQLENALSNLRGYSCQLVCILQDAPQAYRHYGEHTSLLAACGVWLAGANQDITTRELLVKQLGETTEVRESPSASYSAWGVLQGQTQSQAHTPRPLLTSDEIRTLPSDELLIIHEGLPAIKASKWGLSSPRTTGTIGQPWRRLATSGGLAVACLLLTSWALWPSAHAKPTLSQATEIAAPPISGGMDAQASSRPQDTPPTPETPPATGLSFAERWAYMKPPEKPWAIYRDVRGYGTLNGPQREPRLSRWETQETCEVARQEYLEQVYHQIATQPPGQVQLTRLADGRIQQTWGGMAGHPPPIITFLCLKPDDQPS